MKFVDRSTNLLPESFHSERYHRAVEGLRKFYESDYKQSRFKFDSRVWVETKENLKDLFKNRCAYCESHVGVSSHGAVDHFRPKYSAINLDGGSHEGYWWLAYEWSNLYLSCEVCNRHKRNKFPVDGKRAESFDSLAEEKYLLIDPCHQDDIFEAGFYYDNEGLIFARTERGLITIELLSLNRSELIVKRKSLIERLKTEFKLAFRDITSQTEVDSYGVELKEKLFNEEYQGLIDYFINNWTVAFKEKKIRDAGSYFDDSVSKSRKPNSPKLGKKNLKVEKQNYPQDFYQKTKLIKDIEIFNFKAIKKLFMDYPKSSGDNESWMMIIGENGVGKSTILQAVSLALSGQKYLDELDIDWSSLIRKSSGARKAEVTINLTNVDSPIKLTITKESAKVSPAEPQMIVLGYGSTRLLPEKRQSFVTEYFRPNIQNLFNQYSQLKDVESWLSDPKAVNSDSFNDISKSLRELLMLPGMPGDDEILLRRRNGSITINLGRSAQKIYELCDGYKSVLAYVLDIMMSIYPFWLSPQNAQGVVLIDEIETHLHPSWKIKIVSLLRNIFPLVNFIVTTHDPLCLRGALKGEVRVLNFSESGELEMNSVDIPLGLPIEDLLLGVWFKMDSTLDEDTNLLIQRHSSLVLENSSNNSNEIRTLEKTLEQRMVPSHGKGLFAGYLRTLDQVLEDEEDSLSEAELSLKISEKLKNKLGG